MGSDMAMEKITVSTYARWEMDGLDQVLIVYRRSSYDMQEQEIWRGYPAEVDMRIDVLQLLCNVPERPEPVLPKRERIRRALRDYYDYCDPIILNEVMEIVEESCDS